MRTISCKEFWRNVEKHVGDKRYTEIMIIFSSIAFRAHTRESLEQFLFDRVLPLMMEAAHINDCVSESEREYQTEAMKVYLEAAEIYFPHILSNPQSISPEEEARLKAHVYPLYIKISNQFAKRRLCHGHHTDGYVCYCDER